MAAKWTRSNVVGMPTGDIVKCLNELEQRIAALTAERDDLLRKYNELLCYSTDLEMRLGLTRHGMIPPQTPQTGA